MMMGKSCSLVVLLLLLMIHSSLSMTRCKKHELEALLTFKHSFTQDPLSLLSSWVSDDCCHWHGVSCDNITSNVIKLNLPNPYETFDYRTALVSSELSPALLELKFLSHLDLSWNNFTDSRIPAFVGSMTKLRYLNLFGAVFSGPIPPQLGNLTNLIHLDLSGNGVDMPSTKERLEWASGLSKLQFLDMNFINMSQTYDALQVLFTLPSLLQLRLYDCFLDKTHLSKLLITNSSTLQLLDVRNNKLEGSFPSFLKNMPFLQSLSLGRNNFSGHVPIWLGNLRGLEYLDISYNKLTGLIQDIFGYLMHLTQLKSLDISSNSIHGTVSHIGNFSKLTTLNMNDNNIKLNLSTHWQPPFQLHFFGANACGISTAFPEWLRNQSKITSLDLSNTGIFGELPQWLWNFTNLYELLLADNKLTGTLPRNFNGRNLEWLDLQNNMLSGTIPHWLKHMKTMYLLNLSGNFLSGRIFEGENASSLLSDYSSLVLLDLSDNMLSGEMQFTNENIRASLVVLRLRRNYFSGLINSKLCDLKYLAVLDLAHNRFTGHIPTCLGSLRFEVFGISGVTDMEFQEIIKGTTEKIAGGTANAHSMIDISCNRLVGTIPEELTNITNLMQLNLSNNHLTGGIPDDIGNIHLLDTLDLSNNNLSGTIPQSLSDIPWLSVLNLSNNKLHGPIPTGRQLQTLDDPSIYAGNSGLCGFPLPNKCSNPNPPPSPTDEDHGPEKDDEAKDNKLDKLWLYLAVMSGVATGFWGVVLTLIFKKSWRYAYFRFVEKVGDRIYVPLKVRMNRFKRA